MIANDVEREAWRQRRWWQWDSEEAAWDGFIKNFDHRRMEELVYSGDTRREKRDRDNIEKKERQRENKKEKRKISSEETATQRPLKL